MALSALSFAGCGDKYAEIKKNRDDYLFGVCNLTSEQLPGIIDTGVDNQWSADKIGAYGAKSTRIWMYIGFYVQREANSNELSLNKGNCDILHDYISKMKANGVERFMGMVMYFIKPYEFNTSDSSCLPSVYDDYDIYVEFLALMEEAYGMLAQEFPEITFWEIGNEPDISHGSWFHKKGYVSGAGDSANSAFKFLTDEAAYITADLCYHAKRAIQAVNPDSKIVLSGLTCTSDGSSAKFLDEIYKQIESGYLPTTEEYSVRDADEYFDILAWHPYPTSVEAFVKANNSMYDVAIEHGDEGKPVFLTEFGFSDFRIGGGTTAERDTEGTQARIAKLMTDCLDAIKEQLPFVETAFVFRLSNVAEYYTDGSMENSFGLFYSPDDTEEWASKPKPIALALFKYFNGENADTTALYKYVANA